MASILLIEDDYSLGNEVYSFLVDSGYAADWAKDGKTAFSYVKKNCYDIYLLDIGLPDCSGLDICKILRERLQEPIIMLTACDSEDDIVEGLSAGADDYVTKPYSLRILQSRIDAQLRKMWRDEKRQVASLITGELIIDLQYNTVIKNGELLPISKIEFELCVALAKSDGNIMPRNLLLERIWDDREQFIENNTLTVHVSRLRKKLGNCEGKLYFDTIKGIGYRWNFKVVGK